MSTFIPTEQLNVRSSDLPWLDFNGQFQYSHAQTNTPLTEIFSGLTTRSNNLGYNTAGSNSSAKWNSSSADVSGTVHLSDKLRLVETFRFRNFSVAGRLSGPHVQFLHRRQRGLRHAAHARSHVPGHDLVAQLQLSRRPGQ